MKVFSSIPTIEEIQEYTDSRYIFFDMDGTLFETEKLHAQALKQTLKTLNSPTQLSISELESKYRGIADNFVFLDFQFSLECEFSYFLKTKNLCFINQVKLSPKITSKKIIDLLTDLTTSGYKLALVTASEKETTDVLLEKEGIASFFELILTREDSVKTKPSPLPYLDALSFFNISQGQALIFEDSVTGLQSAKDSKINYAKANWF